MPPRRSITYPVDLGPEGPNPHSFQSISILLHANTSLIAPQVSSASLCSFLTWTPFVCTPVPCSHPCSFQPHADSCPSINVLRSFPREYMCHCDPVVLVSISSSLAELYFPSSIILSLFPIEHCSKEYLTSILLTRRGLQCWDSP